MCLFRSRLQRKPDTDDGPDTQQQKQLPAHLSHLSKTREQPLRPEASRPDSDSGQPSVPASTPPSVTGPGPRSPAPGPGKQGSAVWRAGGSAGPGHVDVPTPATGEGLYSVQGSRQASPPLSHTPNPLKVGSAERVCTPRVWTFPVLCRLAGLVWLRRPPRERKILGSSSSSSSAFPSYISGVHHFWVRFLRM